MPHLSLGVGIGVRVDGLCLVNERHVPVWNALESLRPTVDRLRSTTG